MPDIVSCRNGLDANATSKTTSQAGYLKLISWSHLVFHPADAGPAESALNESIVMSPRDYPADARATPFAELGDNICCENLGPFGLIDTISTGRDIVSRLYHIVPKLQYWAYHFDRLANCGCEISPEEFRPEQFVSAVAHQHSHVSRKESWHVVSVADYLVSVTLPEILPDRGRICAYTVDEPP